MVLSFLKSSSAPIAIDFGYSELKVLQLAAAGPRPTLLAAARIEIPEAERSDQAARNAFVEQLLPRIIRDANFQGRTVLCSIPAWQTFVQHMQIAKHDGISSELQIKEKLQSVIACDPANVVIRHVEIGDVYRAGEAMTEVICFAVTRDVVLRQVELLKRCRLEIGGLHAEPIAAIRAFDHLYCRDGNEKQTTLYVDIGGNSSKVIVAHGTELKFARSIPIAGRVFDQKVAKALRCEPAAARKLRHAETERARAGAPMTAAASVATASGEGRGGPSTDGNPSDQSGDTDASAERRSSVRSALEAPVKQLTDELQMCLRYHHALFPDRSIDRMIVIGGEARDPGLSRTLAQSVGVPTFVGDPLKRVDRAEDAVLVNLNDVNGQPGWSVVAGLCGCPMDL